MKRLLVFIVLIALLFICTPVAFAATDPSLTQATSAVASRQGDVLSPPSGSIVPQPAVAPPSNAQIAQYVIYGIAIAVVVILLVVFRRRFKRNKDKE